MTAVGVTMRRTIGFARNFPSTALAMGCFLAAAGVSFAFNLRSADGVSASLASVWASSVAPFLPALAAMLAMDTWSDERLSGRIDLLLTTSVRESDLVIGKFLGVWLLVVLAAFASLASALALVRFNAPAAFGALGPADFLPGFAALALQSALWCAVSLATSAFFRHAAASALVACTLMIALPRGLWAAFCEWSAQGRTAFGEMPLDAHAADFAAGVVQTGPMFGYAILAVTALFICTKRVEAIRHVGRHAAGARAGAFAAVLLSIVCAMLALLLAIRLDTVVELPLGSSEGRMSQRTRGILAESQGTIAATCLLPRNDPRFRPVAHMLRYMRAEAASHGAARIQPRFVDPRWNFSEAQRLARLGVTEPSVVFELGRRRAVLALTDGISERNMASALLRLATPPHRTSIYWTAGHGESSFDSYGAFGMSDIARELARDGYRNSALDLSGAPAVPADCALIIIAGGREDISRVEAERLGAYLKQGGRLLVLLGSGDGGGLATLLSAWGVRPTAEKIASSHTLSGEDVVASRFSAHAITSPLKGTQIVLNSPLSLEASSAAGGGGADGIEFSPLVEASGRCIAAAVERGVGTGEDLALRPTRIVVVGDSLFAMNGPLASRANANRDFLLNCVAYLAGTGATTGGEAEGGVLSTGMDRRAWTSFIVKSGFVVPGAAFLLMLAYVASRRRRM